MDRLGVVPTMKKKRGRRSKQDLEIERQQQQLMDDVGVEAEDEDARRVRRKENHDFQTLAVRGICANLLVPDCRN